MHDIYYGTALPPNRKPIPLVHVDDRIGQPWLRVDPEKVVAVVETEAHDRNSPFDPPDDASRRIAGHLLDFLEQEIAHGRLGPGLLPLQSGVGNIANAVLAGIAASGHRQLVAFTEVIQDGMNHLHGHDAGPFDRAIDVQIGRLRRKLGDDSEHPRIIKSVRGTGYVFAAKVERHA